MVESYENEALQYHTTHHNTCKTIEQYQDLHLITAEYIDSNTVGPWYMM